MSALQDEWYQDLAPPDLGEILRRGTEFSCGVEGGIVRWVLAGREIYVLARNGLLNGFVSTTRLTIGEPHVILCCAQRSAEVESALKAAGCGVSTRFDHAMGTPQGWIAMEGVVPSKPVPPGNDGSILDVLCPRAEATLVLEGGIRIERNAWLDGFPPTIRLSGDAASAGPVYIDGLAAVADSSGRLTSLTWEAPGEHRVWCQGQSISYEIRAGVTRWDAWDAHVWSHGQVESTDDQRPGICGMLVRPPPAAAPGRRVLTAPSSNTILLGSAPGEVEFGYARQDLRAPTCALWPSFDPVWALPTDLLHCDKRDARVVLLREVPLSEVADSLNLRKWCDVVLSAARRGLRTHPDDAATAILWADFKKRARQLRRRPHR